MPKPLALALLLAIGAGLNGCADWGPQGAPAAAAEPDCPVKGSKPAKGSMCIGKTGPNWTYAFVYPAEAARIPALDAWLRNESKEDEGDHEDSIGLLAAHAKKDPESRHYKERVYTLDSDLPALLALSKINSSYSGGAHGWFWFESLLWDKTRDRRLEYQELFSDFLAADAEIRGQLCPILAESRRRLAARGGTTFDGPCAEPAYETLTLIAPGGRVTALKMIFNGLDGYAGGTYEIYVPVSRRLLALVADRFRADFALSDSTPRACNSNLGCVDGRPQAPRLQ